MIHAVSVMLTAIAAALPQAPSLVYSTSFGGRDADFGHAIAVDQQGNIYIAGETHSTDFPTLNAAQSACPLSSQRSCSDAFLTKLSPSGQVLYSTFYGSSGNESARAIAVDPQGNAYIAGMADSAAFVARFDPEGRMVYSQRLPGYPMTMAHGIVADADGNAWVVGTTLSNSLFVTGPAFQPQPGGGSCVAVGDTSPFTSVVDGFLLKISPSGLFLYASYLGGSGWDDAQSVALDAKGNVYVAGVTTSRDFRIVGGFQTEYRGGDPKQTGQCEGDDAFIAVFNPDASELVYSTYLGGSGNEEGVHIAVDGFGAVYVAGTTRSMDFPVVRALIPVVRGRDMFVAKLDAARSGLVYATYLGGTGDDLAAAITVDASGRAHVAGTTYSTDFPTVNTVQGHGGGDCGLVPCSDFVVTRFSPSGQALDYATYLGGAYADEARGAALDASGALYVTGSTYERSFPRVNAAGIASGQFHEVAVAKVSPPVLPALATVSGASFASAGPVAPESIASAFGMDLSPTTEGADTLPLPYWLAGRQIRVTDSVGIERFAPLFYVSPTQINFLVPAGTSAGIAIVRLLAGEGQAIAEGSVQVEAVAPGLFTTTSDGKGLAAANKVRAADGALIVVLFGTGIRGSGGIAGVQARVGGQPAIVEYAGPQPTFVGLDQLNIRLPAATTGRVEIEVIVQGKIANRVSVDASD